MAKTPEIEGLETALRELSRLGVNAEKGVEMAVEAMGQKARTTAITSIQRDPKSGQLYEHVFATINGKVVPVGPRSGNNLSSAHRASAPGEAPATDTGHLVSGIKFVRTGIKGLLFNRVRYASWLEYGTKNMLPRPHMEPAVKKHEEWFKKKITKALDDAVRNFNE